VRLESIPEDSVLASLVIARRSRARYVLAA